MEECTGSYGEVEFGPVVLPSSVPVRWQLSPRLGIPVFQCTGPWGTEGIGGEGWQRDDCVRLRIQRAHHKERAPWQPKKRQKMKMGFLESAHQGGSQKSSFATYLAKKTLENI